MAPSDDYVDHVLDLLAPVGRCEARRMFGGVGIFLAKTMLGLIHDGRFYLKVDGETRPAFEKAGGEPFVYNAQGKKMEIGYLTPPEDAFDSPATMAPWARLATQAAGRAAYGKGKKPSKKPEKQASQPTPKKASGPSRPIDPSRSSGPKRPSSSPGKPAFDRSRKPGGRPTSPSRSGLRPR